MVYPSAQAVTRAHTITVHNDVHFAAALHLPRVYLRFGGRKLALFEHLSDAQNFHDVEASNAAGSGPDTRRRDQSNEQKGERERCRID